MPRANQLVISTWLHSPVLSSHLALNRHNYTSSAVYGHRIGCSFHRPTIHIYFPPACWSGHRHSCLALLLKVKLQPAMQPYLGYHGISIATQQATSDLGCRPSCHQSGSSTPFIQSQVCDVGQHHAVLCSTSLAQPRPWSCSAMQFTTRHSEDRSLPGNYHSEKEAEWWDRWDRCPGEHTARGSELPMHAHDLLIHLTRHGTQDEKPVQDIIMENILPTTIRLLPQE